MSTVDLTGVRWRKSSRSNGANNANCVEVAFVDAGWRKSSRSNDGGNGNCVEVAFVDAGWRKSSRSNAGGNGNCVEVAFAGPVIAVRDSKNPAGALAFAAPQWGAFLTAAKHGHFDRP